MFEIEEKENYRIISSYRFVIETFSNGQGGFNFSWGCVGDIS
jgi:hypothetical protein